MREADRGGVLNSTTRLVWCGYRSTYPSNPLLPTPLSRSARVSPSPRLCHLISPRHEIAFVEFAGIVALYYWSGAQIGGSEYGITVSCETRADLSSPEL